MSRSLGSANPRCAFRRPAQGRHDRPVRHAGPEHAAEWKDLKHLDHLDLILVTRGHLGLLDAAHGQRRHVMPLRSGIAITMARRPFVGVFAYQPAYALSRGKPAGFVTRLENGFTIYHTGDTALFGDTKLIAKMYIPISR